MDEKEHGFWWHFLRHVFVVFGNTTGTLFFWLGVGFFVLAVYARASEHPKPASASESDTQRERDLSLDDIPLPWSLGALGLAALLATVQATRRAERAVVRQEALRLCPIAYLSKLDYKPDPLREHDDDIPESNRRWDWHALVAVKNPTPYPLKLVFVVEAQSPEGAHTFMFGVESFSDSDGNGSEKLGSVDGALNLAPQTIRTYELRTYDVVKYDYRKRDARLVVEDVLAGNGRASVPLKGWAPIPTLRPHPQ